MKNSHKRKLLFAVYVGIGLVGVTLVRLTSSLVDYVLLVVGMSLLCGVLVACVSKLFNEEKNEEKNTASEDSEADQQS